MNLDIRKPCIVVAFCLAGLHAQADPGPMSAVASLSDLRISLLDLDPLDGIAPTLTLVGRNEPDSPLRQTFVYTTLPDRSDGPRTYDYGAFGSAASLSVPLLGHVFAADALPGDAFADSGSLGGAARWFGVGPGSGFAYSDLVLGYITLSPHTRLTVTALGSAQVSVTTPVSHTALAVAQIEVRDKLTNNYLALDGVRAAWYSPGFSLPSDSRQLSITFENAGSVPIGGQLNATAYVYGTEIVQGPPPSVPEPFVWQSFLIGLVALFGQSLKKQSLQRCARRA